MYCPRCGAQNSDNAWRCVQCGEVLQGAPPPPPFRPPPPHASVPSRLAEAIIVTICCCWPLGIPAIIYAAQVNAALARGDYEGARRSSATAMGWIWAAVVCGIIAGILYGFYYAFVIANVMGGGYH